MTATRIAFLTALAVSAFLRPISAQQAAPRIGQRVRVVSSTDGIVHEGTLAFVMVDTVVLQQGERQEWLKLDGNDHLEVLRRTRTHALLGAAIGAGIGAAVGSTSSRHPCIEEANITNGAWRMCGISSAVGAVLYGLGGMGLGAAIGGRFKSQVWDPFGSDQLVPLRVTIAPAPSGGVAVGASFAF